MSDVGVHRQLAEALTASLKAMRHAEYHYDTGCNDDFCTVCETTKSGGHSDGCAIACAIRTAEAALAAYEAEERKLPPGVKSVTTTVSSRGVTCTEIELTDEMKAALTVKRGL
jgi:hypothetical protein